jgi:hypothetical protein
MIVIATCETFDAAALDDKKNEGSRDLSIGRDSIPQQPRTVI